VRINFWPVWRGSQRRQELTFPTFAPPFRFAYNAVCDGGCQKRAHGFRLSPKKHFPDGDDQGCQQKNGKSYPKFCMDPVDATTGEPWSLAGLKSKEIKEVCNTKLGHDRGHQIPANNFDYSKSVCKMTNYMTNILPQADKMNRGAWLKTEMMGECWRQEQPLTIMGGALFLGQGGNGKTVDDVPGWGGVDRTEWFVPTHKVSEGWSESTAACCRTQITNPYCRLRIQPSSGSSCTPAQQTPKRPTL